MPQSSKKAKNSAPKRKRKATIENTSQRRKNEIAKDQFAALGYFIQHFESVAMRLRYDCTWMVRCTTFMMDGQLKPKASLVWDNITSLPFHHESLTAKPLVDIWRAMLSEHCKGLATLSILAPREQKIVDELAREVQREVSKLGGVDKMIDA